MNKAIFYSILTAVFFSTLEPVSKLIAGAVNPYAITFWRFFIGSLFLLPFAIIKIKRDKIKIDLKSFGIMTLMGAVFVCVIMLALQSAIKLGSSPSITAMLFSTNSVFTLLLALWILKEPFTANKLIAIILCFVGILLCTDFTQQSNTISFALALFAAVTFSVYSNLSKKYMTKIGGMVQTTITFFMGSIVMLILLLVTGTDISFSPDGKTSAILLYLGILVTGVGYWSYFVGMEKGGAMIGSLAFFIKPVLTPFIAWITNGIVPDFRVFSALAFIVAGSFFGTYAGKRKTARKETSSGE